MNFFSKYTKNTKLSVDDKVKILKDYMKENDLSIRGMGGVTWFIRNDNNISEEIVFSWIRKQHPNF